MRSRALKSVLNLVEEVPVEQAFLRDLNYSIIKDDEKSVRVASRTYKPSSMHCMRNMYFQITGATPLADDTTSERVGICESGTDRHSRIQLAVEAMKENGIDCEYVDVGEYVTAHNLTDRLEIKSKMGNETKLYHKQLNISFLCDGIIRYLGKYYILEIKTETSGKFWTQDNVMPEHYLQGTAYSLCFDIEDVIFLYENRDNCAKKTFMLHVTDEMRNSLEKRIRDCDDFVDRNVVPPKPEDLQKKTCAYCGYKQECQKYV